MAAGAAARAAWSGVLGVSNETFVRHVASRLPLQRDPIEALKALHTADLFLAAACLAGDPAALRHFDEHLLSRDSPALRRMRIPADVIEEARQVLRHRLFVGLGAEGKPKIAEYSGTGPLRAWLRAAIVNEALQVHRGPRGRVAADDSMLASVASPANDLELDYLKRRYGADACAALRDGFARLTDRDRNILRQYFALGLGVDEIASCYRVHRATAARWVAKAREALKLQTRELLAERLRVEREDVSSILRLLQSQIQEALTTLLASEPNLL